LQVPSVSVKVDITSLIGSRLNLKGSAETVNFNAKAKLEERERKSQTVTLGFGLLLTTKPSIVKFEIEGTATLTGKDEDIRKMLEIGPETKVPNVLFRVYQHAFTAMYLLSTILNTPPPPQDLLGPQQQVSPIEDVTVTVDAKTEESAQAATPQAETANEEKNTPSASEK
jgi:hypothetical protein